MKKQIGQRLRSIIQEICSKNEMSKKRGNIIRVDHAHVLVSAPAYLSIEKIEQILKGKRSYIYQREFPELKKRNWGQYLWARGYFCSTVGVVTEEIVKKYIEEQEDDDNFKKWDKDLFLN